MPGRTARQEKSDRAIPIPLFREHPAKILRSDLELVVRKAPYLAYVLWPFAVPTGITPPASAGKYAGGLPSVALQVVLLLASLVSVAAIFASILLAGPGLVGSIGVSYAFFKLQAKYFQGKVVVKPTIQLDKPDAHADEAWFTINGICTGQIQSSVDFLSEAFQRPVTGVHNKTAGFLFDIVECIIQRDFNWPTQDGTVKLYRLLKGALTDSKKKRVVLIAHSQGGIIASLILDFLLADLPQADVAKLELYTFGTAANHYNSPITAPGADGRDGEPVVKHVEHYANQLDYVAQIGVLNWQVEPGRGSGQNDQASSTTTSNDKNDTRFYGSLFQRNLPGHLLIEHYFRWQLDPSADWPATATDGRPSRLWQYLGGKTPV